jgi:hypothetical protein
LGSDRAPLPPLRRPPLPIGNRLGPEHRPFPRGGGYGTARTGSVDRGTVHRGTVRVDAVLVDGEAHPTRREPRHQGDRDAQARPAAAHNPSRRAVGAPTRAHHLRGPGSSARRLALRSSEFTGGVGKDGAAETAPAACSRRAEAEAEAPQAGSAADTDHTDDTDDTDHTDDTHHTGDGAAGSTRRAAGHRTPTSSRRSARRFSCHALGRRHTADIDADADTNADTNAQAGPQGPAALRPEAEAAFAQAASG